MKADSSERLKNIRLREQVCELADGQAQLLQVVEGLSKDVDGIRYQVATAVEDTSWIRSSVVEPDVEPRPTNACRPGWNHSVLEDELTKMQAKIRERHQATLREFARHWALLEELQMLQAETSAKQRLSGEDVANLSTSHVAIRQEVSSLSVSTQRLELLSSTIRSEADQGIAGMTYSGFRAELAEMRRLSNDVQEEHQRILTLAQELRAESACIVQASREIRHNRKDLENAVADLRNEHGEFANIFAHMREGQAVLGHMSENLRDGLADMKHRISELDGQLWLTDSNLRNLIHDALSGT